MVVHPEINDPDARSFAYPDNQGRRRRPSLPVEREPVELHIHAVGNCAVWENCIFLQRNQIVFIYTR